MAIDWADTGAMISGWGALVGASALVWTAFKATKTADNWTRQQLTKRRFEHAEKTVAAAYQIRRTISFIRHPRYVVGIRARSEVGWKSASKEKRARIVRKVTVLERLESTNEDWERVADVIPLATALIGPKTDTALEHLYRYHELFEGWAYLFVDSSDEESEETLRRSLERPWDVDDEVTPSLAGNVDALISRIESECLPILRG